MHSFVAHRSETQVDAGSIGSFATTWDGTECIATDSDGTKWRFSVKDWAGGRAWAHHPKEDQPIGTYQRKKTMSYDGEVTFRGAAYGVRHSGRLHKTYLLTRDEIDMMNLRFKQGYVLGDTVEGDVARDLDAGLALFFVWLVYVFRNEDVWMASTPPALS
jgi:hypothetical protein